jgi:hypothetical protein
MLLAAQLNGVFENFLALGLPPIAPREVVNPPCQQQHLLHWHMKIGCLGCFLLFLALFFAAILPPYKLEFVN